MEWNRRFLVSNGNGMEENCQYGIWKNRLPFHSIPCPALNKQRKSKTKIQWRRLTFQIGHAIMMTSLVIRQEMI